MNEPKPPIRMPKERKLTMRMGMNSGRGVRIVRKSFRLFRADSRPDIAAL